MKKRVAVLLTSSPHDGGQHQYLLTMMNALKNGQDDRYELLGICCSRFWVDWCMDNDVNYRLHYLRRFTIHEMNHKSKYIEIKKWFNTYSTELGKIVRQENIKVLIGGQQETYIPKMNCKIISLIHDLMHRYEGRFHEIGACYEDHEALYGGMARISDVMIVDSLLGKKQLLECYGDKLKRTHIEVLPFTVPPYITECEEEYVEVPDEYVFYPAQFWRHKNHINLIKAIEILKNKDIHISAVFVGSEKNSLEMVMNYIKKNDLTDYVKIMGYVSNRQIVYLYRHALAMVMPSFFGPTNIPPLEAMALGCPAIVSNNYGMGEQVGDAGLLFNPESPEEIADRIYDVYTNQRLREEMINKGLERAKTWSTEQFERRFVNIVRDTLYNRR